MVGDKSGREWLSRFLWIYNEQISPEADDFTRLFQLCNFCKLGLYIWI